LPSSSTSPLPRGDAGPDRCAPAEIENFLLGAGPPPDVEILRRLDLAAYAYTILPADDSLRASLRPDYLSSLVRHQEIKRELFPLIRAWTEAGIEPILWRGFHLSEFVYPVPGARFHGDVDMLIHPEDEDRASAIAVALGWAEVANTRESRSRYRHTAFCLRGRASLVEVHRFAIHSLLPWTPVQRRVTQAVWARSRVREWEGVPVREMDPTDALLVGLVLQRCWGDRWHLKPCDPIDFRFLQQRCGLDRERLATRARELGCSRTLRIFLERCDPEEGRLLLGAPSQRQLRGWNRAVFAERGPLGTLQSSLSRLYHLPQYLGDFVYAAPAMFRARRALRRRSAMREVLEALTPVSPGSPPSPAVRRRTVRAVRRLSRVLPRNAEGDCLLRSLTIYTKLRREGLPVVFRSGVRRTAEGIVGHAWVELDGVVLPELGEPDNPTLYRVNFTYPDQPVSGAGRVADEMVVSGG